MVSELDWESRIVRANGQRVHLKIAGSGPLVLLCHGFPESWYSWRHQLRALSAAGYRVAAPDMPGYGRSSKPTEVEAYRITELVATCAGVVEALGETTATIVGHDWGAPVAWTAAWTRPETFTAVAGLSVPFGGRGLMGLPGDPWGRIRPSVAQRELGGDDHLFYQEYFCLPGGVAAREADEDLRGWLTGAMFSLSADAPLPPELAGADLSKLPREALPGFIRAAMCVPNGAGFGEMLQRPEKLPDWLDESDLDVLVGELQYTGIQGGLNYYRNVELDWEILAAYQDRPITVPSLFVGGDRDVATIWGQEAIARAPEMLTDLRGSVVLRDCGHWIQQEEPEATNAALLEFLGGL
jgi:pimeloyl-ACP methyl ester carboxylesterase